MEIPEQHDDHIWVTVGGGAWAIKKIRGNMFHLWRGYWPIEYAVLEWPREFWEDYAIKAANELKEIYK